MIGWKRGKDERSNVTHLEGKRGRRKRGGDNRRRKGEKGEEGRRLDGKKGNTKGVIGPKERAKVGGAGEVAIMTGKKIRIGMSKKGRTGEKKR